jgi:hypothetical protein
MKAIGKAFQTGTSAISQYEHMDFRRRNQKMCTSGEIPLKNIVHEEMHEKYIYCLPGLFLVLFQEGFRSYRATRIPGEVSSFAGPCVSHTWPDSFGSLYCAPFSDFHCSAPDTPLGFALARFSERCVSLAHLYVTLSEKEAVFDRHASN